MNEIPNELKYTNTHEWARLEDDGKVTIGITDHAQELLGDIVYVELPDPIKVAAGDETAVVESVKAASDVYSPLSGKVIEVNEALVDAPALINTDPYGDGWLFRVEPTDMTEYKELLDAEKYQAQVESEAH